MGKVIQNFARNRNYGCRITVDIFFGNIPAVVLENEHIRMTILAGRGADVVEFLYKPYVLKPKPGMLFQAQRDFHIDLSNTYFVGDDVRSIDYQSDEHLLKRIYQEY